MGNHPPRKLTTRLRKRPGFVAAVLAVAAAGAWFWNLLPEPLFQAPVSSVLLARDGQLLGARVAADGQWRFSPGDAVPERFAAALIQYEDRRFRFHPGVDPLALARAARDNIARRDVVSGGSTITMQVIRMGRGNRPRTYREKIVEMLWALRLDLTASKDEVLAMYAANAPFGGNVVGLEAASWRYFGRSPIDLSWAEAATLAVLPNSPSLIHPGRNRNELEQKRNRLLRRLNRAGLIDDMEFRLSMAETLPGAPNPIPLLAPHLLATLDEETPDNVPASHRYATTISWQRQRAVLDVVGRHGGRLEEIGIGNVAALVIDNRTFEVVAYAGNSRWELTPGSGYAIDLIRRPRSTGSILKPLLFASMLDAGEIVPQTLVPDLPTQYDGYMPENYDGQFRGAVPARVALARSLNVPAVRMLRVHGVDRFYDFLRSMGLSTINRPPRDYGLTLILGGAEANLWDLTTAYANLAYLGGGGSGDSENHAHRAFLLSGKKSPAGGESEMSVGAAWLTLDALLEVVRPEGASNWREFSASRQIAWKTGTSYGRRDAWAIGSSTRYTVGVWAGNASGSGRPELTGIGAAAPVMFDVFNTLPRGDSFERPDWALREIEVCRDDGYLPYAGCETEPAFAPVDSHFEIVSPNHQIVHLDATESWQVNAGCEAVTGMVHRSWFVLPPGQEYYYRTRNPTYAEMPPLRADCVGDQPKRLATNPIDFIYPSAGSRVYIPTDLDGSKSRIVFEVAHRDPGARLFWHLDDRYLGETTSFHEMALDIGTGMHVVTVVDTEGNSARRAIEILSPRNATEQISR